MELSKSFKNDSHNNSAQDSFNSIYDSPCKPILANFLPPLDLLADIRLWWILPAAWFYQETPVQFWPRFSWMPTR